MNNRYKENMFKSINSMNPYCTPLLYPLDPLDALIGSGTFVIINDVKGILTNYHVARIFEVYDSRFAYIPSPHSFQRLDLRIKFIIYLPDVSRTDANIDMAFIALEEDGCCTVLKEGKFFWNLDEAASSWKQRYENTCQNTIWVMDGNVKEGNILQQEADRTIIYYKNSHPYVGEPDFSKTKENICVYEEYPNQFIVDNLYIPITKEGFPMRFNGISGTILWHVMLDNLGELNSALPMGIATETIIENSDVVKTTAIICRGPRALYESFYPFCSSRLKEC